MFQLARLGLPAAVLAIVVSLGPAEAEPVTGSFTGTVTNGDALDGSFNGINGTTLIGESIVGTFSYDTSSFNLGSSSGVYDVFDGLNPVTITADIGSDVFTSAPSNSATVFLARGL